MARHTILIVDDEENVLSALKRALMDEDYDILSATGGDEGLKLLSQNSVQLVISDERMPVMSGAEFLSHVKQRHPDTVRFMLTGQASIDAAMRAINEGEIYRFFLKPWNDLELVMAIRSALEKYDLEDMNRRLLETVKEQAVELKLLERQYPEISRMKRDPQGRIVVDDISGEDLDEIVRQCGKDFY